MFGDIEDIKAKFTLYAGIFLFLFGTLGAYFQLEPIHNLFYLFATWAYLCLADVVIYKIKDDSLMISRTDEFLFLCVWSAFIWFLIEAANIRLQNWHYMYISSNQALRWAGYALAYSAVLPVVFTTVELLGTFGLFKVAKTRDLPVTPGLLRNMRIGAAAPLALLFVCPEYFLALFSISAILFLEPLNHRLGLRSLLTDLKEGDARKLCLLLTSGFICGILREFWNSQAGARWEYASVAAFDLKFLGIPVMGCVNFALFAAAGYVIYNSITYLRRGKTWEEDFQEPLPGINPDRRLLIAAAVALLIVFYFAPKAIDTHTTWLYLGSI